MAATCDVDAEYIMNEVGWVDYVCVRLQQVSVHVLTFLTEYSLGHWNEMPDNLIVLSHVTRNLFIFFFFAFRMKQMNAEQNIKSICDSASMRIVHLSFDKWKREEGKNGLRGIGWTAEDITANDLLIKYFKCAAIDAYTIVIYFTYTHHVQHQLTHTHATTL